MSGAPPDLEALLVALVLAPATYSRNRFFEMYTDPAVRRVRRRAAFVRSIVRQIAPTGGASPSDPAHIAVTSAPAGYVELTYVVPALGLRRTTCLDPMEAALVRFTMARARARTEREDAPTALPEGDPDRMRIEAALRRLAPMELSSHRPAERPHPSAEQEPPIA